MLETGAEGRLEEELEEGRQIWDGAGTRCIDENGALSDSNESWSGSLIGGSDSMSESGEIWTTSESGEMWATNESGEMWTTSTTSESGSGSSTDVTDPTGAAAGYAMQLSSEALPAVETYGSTQASASEVGASGRAGRHRNIGLATTGPVTPFAAGHDDGGSYNTVLTSMTKATTANLRMAPDNCVQHWPAHGKGTGPRGSAPRPRYTGSSAKRRRKSTMTGLDLDVAYRLLTGDPTTYPPRPKHLRATQEQQIFLEKPPERRPWGAGDRWRNSGGLRGGTVVWINEKLGVRKRYGTIVRGDRPHLFFHHFSLVTRESVSEDTPIGEDSSAYLYTVKGCSSHEVEEELPASPALPEKREKASHKPHKRSRGRRKAAKLKAGPKRQSVATSAAGHAPPSVPTPPVLDFGLLPSRSESKKGPADVSASSEARSIQDRRRIAWLLRKTTIVALSMVTLAVVTLTVVWSLSQQGNMLTPASSAICPAGTYMPRSDMLEDCVSCTDCIAQGSVEQHSCTPTSDAVCGNGFGPVNDQAALLAIKATQQDEATAVWGDMTQWRADDMPCATIDESGRGWPGCMCDSIDERVLSFSASGIDIAAPMNISLVGQLTAVRYISLYGKTAVIGDVQGLSSLVQLRWLDLRGTSVEGRVSALVSLIHIGECWRRPPNWPVGGDTLCAPQYAGGLLLAETHVHGRVNKLQALPGLGLHWRPDAIEANDTSQVLRLGSFSSCAAFKGCGNLQGVAHPASFAGTDVTACCEPPTTRVDLPLLLDLDMA